MPELLDEGLPDKSSRAKFNFTEWADGRAWKFVKGTDYDSSTESFRASVKRWARAHGYRPEFHTFPALDRNGRDVPLTKSDAVALGVKFTRESGGAAGAPGTAGTHAAPPARDQ